MSKSKKTKPAIDQLELDRVKARLARALADYRNLEARTKAEISRQVQDKLSRFAEEVIVVYESFDKLRRHYQDDVNLRAVADQFRSFLERWEIKPVEVKVGDPFNPEISQCLAVTEGQVDRVTEVIRPGFMMAGRLIRPALVKVGKGKKLNKKQGGDHVKNNRD